MVGIDHKNTLGLLEQYRKSPHAYFIKKGSNTRVMKFQLTLCQKIIYLFLSIFGKAKSFYKGQFKKEFGVSMEAGWMSSTKLVRELFDRSLENKEKMKFSATVREGLEKCCKKAHSILIKTGREKGKEMNGSALCNVIHVESLLGRNDALLSSIKVKNHNALVCNAIASCYEYGVGVKKNEIQEFKWNMRSAKQGNAKAQKNVGVFYGQGLGGLTRD